MAARRPCDTSPSLEQTADLMPPLCCICAPDADHTMFRIKDAKVSLKFYTEILGMELGASVSESIDVETEPQLIRCSCISVQSTSRMAATLPSRSKLHGLALTREMHDDLLLILQELPPSGPFSALASFSPPFPRSYFLAFPEEGKEHLSAEEKADRKFMREGILELCHNVSFRDASKPAFLIFPN